MSESGGMSVNCLTAGGQNVATDVKGNITTLPGNLRPTGATTAMNLTWDSDNKLRSADIDANGTADVNFQYDALGRRVARSGTGGSEVYVQMDQQTIADYPVGGAATTPTFRYVYASYIDEPVVRKTAGTGGTLVYFHRNHQYSVTAVTTSTGAIAERYAYSAYGQPTILDASASVLSSSAINNRYAYTGREWDATLGLHHFRARWMSGLTGRFLTRDPIGFKGSPFDLYEFLASSPCGLVDPFGKEVCGVGPLIYFGSWCVSDDTWRAFEDESYDNFSKYVECEMTIHKNVWYWVAEAGAVGGGLFCERVPVCKKSAELLSQGLGPTIEKQKFTSLLSTWEFELRKRGWLSRGNILRGHMNSVKRFPAPSACGTAVAAIAMVELSVSWYCTFKAMQ